LAVQVNNHFTFMSFFERIVNWNEERGLIEPGYDYLKETSFIIEELLESTGKYDSWIARDKALAYAKEIIENSEPSDENVLDAWSDIIIFAIGAIAKKGYNPEKVLEEVYKEIDSRTGKRINGKFVRDKDALIYQANFDSCKR